MRIALARCCDLPEHDMDERVTLDALHAAGHAAECLHWDDPHAEPASTFDAVVIRATWNYISDPQRFLNWVDRTAHETRLYNAPAAVRWNLHKQYLTTLAAAGVPVVPTRVVRTGGTIGVADLAAREGWDEVVIKPAVGAGSFLTHRFGADDPAAQAFLDRYAGSQDMLVQRFMPSVQTGGERALVVIDGELTHAVTKAPRFADGSESVDAAPVNDDDRAFVAAVLSAQDFGDLLYARVDVMRADDGSSVLSELELIEPSLFFPFGGDAVDKFVAALERRHA